MSRHHSLLVCAAIACAEPEPTIERVGEVLPLHETSDGRGVFADVMLTGDDTLVTTYQLAGSGSICADKSLYFQTLDRDLSPIQGPKTAIDVTTPGTVFRPTEDEPGDLGDHKFTVLGDTIYMLTTLAEEPEARL